MAEHHGLPVSPIIVMNLGTVFGRNRAHGYFSADTESRHGLSIFCGLLICSRLQSLSSANTFNSRRFRWAGLLQGYLFAEAVLKGQSLGQI
jgi:hypothetical protein